MKPIKLPFGLNGIGILVHISEVEKGKKCGYICPACKSPLIARKGDLRQDHFQHATLIECEGAFESAVHLAAKRIIAERRRLTLPQYLISISSIIFIYTRMIMENLLLQFLFYFGGQS